ncbi:MAG: hypothetical protein LC104_09055 [Bacteroidales bacterium]|nr:hypothetical protein [Bacteroidales bacterium]
MTETAVALTSLEELTRFVHQALCQQDSLDPGQTPLVRTPLTRHRRPCGALFHVEGPRLLRTSAIWAADENRILFYDSSGTRSREILLSESPEVEEPRSRRAA